MPIVAVTTIFCNETAWLWALVQAIAVTVTLALIAYQIRLQRLSDIVQSLCTLQQRWNSEPMIRARKTVCTRWLAQDRRFDGTSEYVAEFIEELGHYFKIHAISKDALWSAYSWHIEHYYWIFRDGFIADRSRFNDSTLYCDFEQMFVKMVRMSRRRGARPAKREESALTTFAENEIQLSHAHLVLGRPSEEKEPESTDYTQQAEQDSSCAGANCAAHED